MSIARYSGDRLVKAITGRSGDATVTAIGSTLRRLASRGFSLVKGQERYGWFVGLDGVPRRELDDSAADVLAQLSLNEIVYACMRERMKALIQPAFIVERKQSDGTYEAEPDHDLAALIRRPSDSIDTPTLWRCLEASYASVGRVYLEPLYQGGRLAGVNPLNPAWIEEKIEYGRLMGYIWKPPEAPWLEFGVKDLITRRAVEWADVPPLYAALGATYADAAASQFIAAFFSGGGVPSSIFKTRDDWSQERADDFRAEFMRRFSAGSRVPLIIGKSIESYERVGVSLDELDNQSVRTFIETRICMCFGVSPLIIYSYAGLLRAIESNLNEAWESFWDATALPLLKEWSNWLDWALLTQYESRDDVLLGNVRCRFDPSGIGPYQEDVNAKVAMYQTAYSSGAVTLDELRGVMGLGPMPKDQLPEPEPEPEPDEDEGKTMPLLIEVSHE